MEEKISFESIGAVLGTFPLLALGVLAVVLASSLLVVAPTVYVRNIGIVGAGEAKSEHRNVAFTGLILGAGVFLAVSWMLFTQTAAVYGTIL